MKYFCFILFALSSFNVVADELTVMDHFFTKNGTNNRAAEYTGEMSKFIDMPTVGQGVKGDVEAQYRLLESDDSKLIYAVLLKADHYSQNWYAYLQRDNGDWKLSAVRTLALPKFYTITSISKLIPEKSMRSQKEEALYQNVKMTNESDENLKQYLRDNIEKLNEVASLSKIDVDAAVEKAKALFFTTARYDPSSKIVDIIIGGIMDNSVGYMYIPDLDKKPIMSNDEYIYIEHIIDSWFIYKTT